MLQKLQAGGRTPVIPQTIGDRMREARRDVGAKQTEMAEALEISRQTVLDWERGKRIPSKIAIVAWAMVTGVSSDWLISGQGDARSEACTNVLHNRRATDRYFAAPLCMEYPAVELKRTA